MYYQLIHTRCRDGIELLKDKKIIRGGSIGGFKVFSCSEKVTTPAFADLQFLDKICSEKQSYRDPTFMDDAYIYYVPDIGARYLVDFHPIHFDPNNVKGDYPHRSGNFINQVYLGSFSDFYPYETFGNNDVWDAKTHEEGYYYETEPYPLPERNSLDDSIGYISFDDISSFINNGRRAVLINAIAFIISQYSLPPENRKFLVIKDTNSRQIELWIAAIESAFSPRVSSGLSFATRLDMFATKNKYTVNLNGQYQTQINLQSPNHKLRYRAMIVGVDERDSSNYNNARALANSSFVVLDGKNSTMSVATDCTHPFFQLATSYDDNHVYFCREFLQSIQLEYPSDKIFELYSAYNYLKKYETSNSLQDLVQGLKILDSFRMIKSPYIERLYYSVKKNFVSFLKQDAISAFSVLKWIKQAAELIGDKDAMDDFIDVICQTFVEAVYTRPSSSATDTLFNIVRDSTYRNDVFSTLLDNNAFYQYKNLLVKYNYSDWISFTRIITSCLQLYKNQMPDVTRKLYGICLYQLFISEQESVASKISAMYYNVDSHLTYEMMIYEAKQSDNDEYINFIISIILQTIPNITASENSMKNFYSELCSAGLESYFEQVLKYKINTLTNLSDAGHFLTWISSSNDFRNLDLSYVFYSVDEKLSITDKLSARIAEIIQHNKPSSLVCIRSAHIYALEVFGEKINVKSIKDLLNYLAKQRFPSIKDEAYAERLIDKIISFDWEKDDDFSLLIELFSESDYYLDKLVNGILKCYNSRKSFYLCELFETAALMNDPVFYHIIVKHCAELRVFDREMSFIESAIKTKKALQYFRLIQNSAEKIVEEKRKNSPFGRFFQKMTTKDTTKRNKK